MIRWWLVGACAMSFSESMSIWQYICQMIRNSSRARSKIATCTPNFIKNKQIINDLYLLTSFHKVFLFPHFKYLQLGDDSATGTPSFQARHLLVRHFHEAGPRRY